MTKKARKSKPPSFIASHSRAIWMMTVCILLLTFSLVHFPCTTQFRQLAPKYLPPSINKLNLNFGEVNLNLWGQGSLRNLSFGHPNVLRVREIEFEIFPLGLLVGEIKLRKISINDLEITGPIDSIRFSSEKTDEIMRWGSEINMDEIPNSSINNITIVNNSSDTFTIEKLQLASSTQKSNSRLLYMQNLSLNSIPIVDDLQASINKYPTKIALNMILIKSFNGAITGKGSIFLDLQGNPKIESIFKLKNLRLENLAKNVLPSQAFAGGILSGSFSLKMNPLKDYHLECLGHVNIKGFRLKNLPFQNDYFIKTLMPELQSLYFQRSIVRFRIIKGNAILDSLMVDGDPLSCVGKGIYKDFNKMKIDLNCKISQDYFKHLSQLAKDAMFLDAEKTPMLNFSLIGDAKAQRILLGKGTIGRVISAKSSRMSSLIKRFFK